jgi:hypothetical protein
MARLEHDARGIQMTDRNTKAFALSAWQAVIAQQASKTSDPALQVVGCGAAISICGAEALNALKSAVEHALQGSDA